MNWQSLLLVSSGAALGASSRWGLGLLLNPLFASFSFGTLIANYLGCFIAGVLLAVMWQDPQLSSLSSAFSSQWRLFLITGFLGSFTTFSAFSSEVIANFVQDNWLNGLKILFLHLVGCLIFTGAGVYLYKSLN